MSFKNGAYAMIWGDGNNYGGDYVCKQISISRQDEKTGEYSTAFRGYVRFVDKAADVVRNLPPKSHIRINDCGTYSHYNKQKDANTYTFFVYSCECVGQNAGSNKIPKPVTQRINRKRSKIYDILEGDFSSMMDY